MILSHFNYCLTSWSQAGKSARKPLEILYKQLKLWIKTLGTIITAQLKKIQYFKLGEFSEICKLKIALKSA